MHEKKQRKYVQGPESVNLRERLYWNEGLGMGKIVTLIDEFGDETEDEAEAVAAVAKISDNCWVDIDLTSFESVSNH